MRLRLRFWAMVAMVAAVMAMVAMVPMAEGERVLVATAANRLP